MSEPLTSLPVEHLFSAHLDVSAPTTIKDGPEGTKLIVGITGGTITGDKVNGSIVPNSGGDWVSIGAKGDLRIDVRFSIMTDDGAPIYVEYRGILLAGKALCGPLFHTGDERYEWLNKLQGIGIGNASAEGVDYDFYGLR